MANVTLIDIAREAGVCKATVVKVLSGGDTNIRVRPETAERIRAVAARLQYRPNLNARALTGRSMHLIGLLVDSVLSYSNIQILTTVERLAAQHGYRVMIAETHNDMAGLHESYQILLQHGVDGVISLAHDYPGEEATLQRCFANQPHLVFAGRPSFDECNYVDIRYDLGIRKAVEHLLARGCRRPGMLMENPIYGPVRLQEAGFRALVPEADSRIRVIDSADPGDDERHAAAMPAIVEEFILGQQLDAVVVTTDVFAVGLLSALAVRGLRVPGDVAVIGNNNERVCNFSMPRLTSIDENNVAVGTALWEMLMESVEGTGSGFRRREVIPQLAIRESA